MGNDPLKPLQNVYLIFLFQATEESAEKIVVIEFVATTIESILRLLAVHENANDRFLPSQSFNVYF